MSNVFQIRIGDTFSYPTNELILPKNELAIEVVTGRFKIGDGITDWYSLPYSTEPNNYPSPPSGPVGGVIENKILTLNKNLTIHCATDTTLDIGSGGTLGALAYSTISGTALLKADGNGNVIPAIPGTDYLTSTSSIPAANLTGSISPYLLGSGTADSTTYLRGDGHWATVNTGPTGLTSIPIVDSSSTSSLYYLASTRQSSGAFSIANTFSTSLYYNNSSNILTVPAISITNNTPSTSISTGSLIISGGIGISGDVYANSFTGTGSGITSLNASNINSGTIGNSYLPTVLTGQTYNGLTNTANTIGFSIAGGTTSKTLTVNNSISISGLDNSSLNIGSGGTLGTAAFTNTGAYQIPIGTISGIAKGNGINSLTAAVAGIDYAPATTGNSILKADNNGGFTNAIGGIDYQTPIGTFSTSLIKGTGTVNGLQQAVAGTDYLLPTGSGAGLTSLNASNISSGTLGNSYITSSLSGKTYDGLSHTANAIGFSIAGGTTSKTLTINNSISISGLDNSSLNIGSGGTLGTAAFTSSSSYQLPIGTFSTALIKGTGVANTIQQAIAGTDYLLPTGSGSGLTSLNASNISSGTIGNSYLPTTLTGQTYNGLTNTANATGFSIAGGTTSKTLTITNTLTLSGTDSSTLNIGSGGTLGTAAYTNSTAYQSPIGTISGIAKGNGANSLTAAVAGTDYLLPTGSGAGLTSLNASNISSGTLGNSYITSTLSGKTYDGLSHTANATGFSISGGTTSKTLTVNNSIGISGVDTKVLTINNSLTLSGTDSSTLNIGSGGTLGTAAYTNSTAYQAPIGTISGIAKGNGANLLTAAVAGTDYLLPTGSGAGLTGILPTALTGSGVVPTAALGTGTANSTTYLRGDNTWQTISSGSITITDDNSTSSSAEYLGMFRSNTGTASSVYTASTKLTFIPSTGIFSSPAISVTNTTVSSSISTGALIISGGAGIAGAVYANSFTGSGSGLTSLNASNISSGTLGNSYLPTTLTGKTYDGLSHTANAIGFSIAGGTTNKTLTVNNSIGISGVDTKVLTINNSLTLSGTDGSTLNIGTGGTLGTAAYTNSTAYQAPIGTISGIAKGNGANSLTAAVAGTDYLLPTGSGSGLTSLNASNISSGTIGNSYLPTTLIGQTYNGLTNTANAIGFSITGGTTSKTLTINNSIGISGVDTKVLTINNSLTLSGTDSSTLNIGTGGTLGTAAYTNLTAYAPAAGSSSIITLGNVTTGSVANMYGGILGSISYQSAPNVSAFINPNITATQQFLVQTGTGSVSSAPVWHTLTMLDLGSGTANSSTYLRGDGTWASVSTGSLSITDDNSTSSSAEYLGMFRSNTGSASSVYTASTKLTFIPSTGVFSAPAISITNSTPATSTITGALLVAGGIGVVGDVYANSFNGSQIIENTSGFSITGGLTTNKTLTVNNSIGISGVDTKVLTINNSLTLSGTDGSTLNIGTGGTLQPIATTPITGTPTSNTYLRGDNTWASPRFNYGTAQLNFGNTPGTNYVSTTITGQTGFIAATSIARAWIVQTVTTDHNAIEHLIIAANTSVICDTYIDNTGFTIYAFSQLRIRGLVSIIWEWN